MEVETIEHQLQGSVEENERLKQELSTARKQLKHVTQLSQSLIEARQQAAGAAPAASGAGAGKKKQKTKAKAAQPEGGAAAAAAVAMEEQEEAASEPEQQATEATADEREEAAAAAGKAESEAEGAGDAAAAQEAAEQEPKKEPEQAEEEDATEEKEEAAQEDKVEESQQEQEEVPAEQPEPEEKEEEEEEKEPKEEQQEQQEEEEGHKRPRGRAPKGKVWNAQSGVWEAKHKPVRKPCSPGRHRMKRKWLTRGVGCLQAAMVLDTEGDKENAGQQRPRRGGRKRKGQGGAGMSNASTASSFLRRAFFQARVPSTSGSLRSGKVEEEVVRIEALAERNRGAAPRRTTRQTARAAAKRQRA